MNRFTIYIWSLILLMPVDLFAQVSLSVFGGLGTYKMHDLKGINRLQAESLPIETVTVDNFSPGLFAGTSYSINLSEQLLLGLNFQYNSTGSRIGQRDYSGYYSYDQLVNGYLIGIEPETIIEQNKSFSLSLSLVTGLYFTRLKMREAITIFGQDAEYKESFAALSIPFYPALKFSIPVFDAISGAVSFGYLIDPGSKFHLKGNKDAVLVINNNPVKTGWTGLRITVGLKYAFNTAKSDQAVMP
jgi:hypothetical protein